MPQEPVSPTSVQSDEYRQLEAQHHEYESRLGELADKAVLSDEEQVEETTLKKKKLQIKDRLQEMVRRGQGAVAPPERRRGIARWLLRFAMGRAARRGACRALLEVRAGNREAVALYESLGFRRLCLRREYYREPVEDALVLAREGL